MDSQSTPLFICFCPDGSGRRLQYVAQKRGDGGVDWGYTDDHKKALPLTRRMAKIFVNEGPANRRMEEISHG